MTSLAAKLSRQERRVLTLAAEGYTRSEIAMEMGRAVSTINAHFEHAYSRLGAVNLPNAIALMLTPMGESTHSRS
jgi:DNA-binding NarL/FixJ family response regulator